MNVKRTGKKISPNGSGKVNSSVECLYMVFSNYQCFGPAVLLESLNLRHYT